MAHPEARAWWADVEHLRDGFEQRRAAGTAPAAADARPAVRRTVQISGRGSTAPAPRPLVTARQRPSRALDAATRRPDRIAGWAALLGLVLVLVSTATH